MAVVVVMDAGHGDSSAGLDRPVVAVEQGDDLPLLLGDKTSLAVDCQCYMRTADLSISPPRSLPFVEAEGCCEYLSQFDVEFVC